MDVILTHGSTLPEHRQLYCDVICVHMVQLPCWKARTSTERTGRTQRATGVHSAFMVNISADLKQQTHCLTWLLVLSYILGKIVRNTTFISIFTCLHSTYHASNIPHWDSGFLYPTRVFMLEKAWAENQIIYNIRVVNCQQLIWIIFLPCIFSKKIQNGLLTSNFANIVIGQLTQASRQTWHYIAFLCHQT